jgi:hypothetical protein
MKFTSHNHVCDCGLITTYVNPAELTGLSSRRKSSLIRTLREDAERAGASFVTQEIKTCPRCERKIDFSRVPEIWSPSGPSVIERN